MGRRRVPEEGSGVKKGEGRVKAEPRGQDGEPAQLWPPRAGGLGRRRLTWPPGPPLLPPEPWNLMKCLLPAAAPQTLPQGMRPECPRAPSSCPRELSVALQPAPAAATTASLLTSRATSASASFRLASVTNASSSCEQGAPGREEDAFHLQGGRCSTHKPPFRERRRVMAAQVALRRQQEAQLKRHLAQELMRGAASPKAHSHVKKAATRPGLPRECLWLQMGLGFGWRKQGEGKESQASH